MIEEVAPLKISQKERVYQYALKKKRFTRYECEEFFKTQHLANPKDRISAESVNRYLRWLSEEKDGRLEHPSFMGIFDKSSYQLKGLDSN